MRNNVAESAIPRGGSGSASFLDGVLKKKPPTTKGAKGYTVPEEHKIKPTSGIAGARG